MSQEKKVEERDVSPDELKSGVQLRAGHRVVLIVGGSRHGRRDELQEPDSPCDPDSTQDPDAPGAPENPDGPSQAANAPGTPPAPAPAPTPHDSLDVQVVSAKGARQKNLEFEVTLPDGTKRAGRTSDQGGIRLDNLPPRAACMLLLPDVNPAKDAGEPAQGRVRYQPELPVAAGTATVVELPPRVRRGQLTGLHFETKKTFLLPSAMAGIRQLRALYDSFGGDLAVLISGHTDTVGSADFNRGLSEERAASIASFLTDDADGWTRFYAGTRNSDPWGVREDQFMLATLSDGSGPFYTDRIDGQLGPNTQSGYKRFQTAKALKTTSLPNRDTRRALVTEYMAQDGTSLPQGVQPLTHGCGFFHLAVQTGPGVPREENRRVEIYLFEGEVTPAPQPRCPSGGCAEHPQWVARTESTVDLDKPPGTLAATVLDSGGKPLADADVHASGVIAKDGKSGGDGVASVDGLVPGKYKVIASKDGFTATDGEVEVASGAAAAISLTLQAGVFDFEVQVQSGLGKPLKGAQVSIDAQGAFPQTSGDDGIVVFPQIARGTYNVTATHDGFVQATIQVDVPAPGARNAPTSERALVDAPAKPPGGPARPGKPVVTLQGLEIQLRVKVRTRAGNPISGAKVQLLQPAKDAVTTSKEGLATLTLTEDDRAALKTANLVELKVGKRHHGPDPGSTGPLVTGEITFSAKIDGNGFLGPGPNLNPDGSLDVPLTDGGYAFAAESAAVPARRLTRVQARNEVLFHHLKGRFELAREWEPRFEHDPNAGEFDACDPSKCKMAHPPGCTEEEKKKHLPEDHWLFLARRKPENAEAIIAGVKFFYLPTTSPAQPKAKEAANARFLRDAFKVQNTVLAAIDMRHLVGLVRLCRKLNQEHGIVALYTQGVSGEFNSATHDCHKHGLALDFGGMAKQRPDPKDVDTNMTVRLAIDFLVHLHWGKVPMWDRASVAAHEDDPLTWTRSNTAAADEFDYQPAPGARSLLRHRLAPEPFQDVPESDPPNADLTASLKKLAAHLKEAAKLFRVVHDFAVREYQDKNELVGPLASGKTDGDPTPLDIRPEFSDPPRAPGVPPPDGVGHFVLHPDYSRPNSKSPKKVEQGKVVLGADGKPELVANLDGRQAHANHLHFQIGPTHYEDGTRKF